MDPLERKFLGESGAMADDHDDVRVDLDDISLPDSEAEDDPIAAAEAVDAPPPPTDGDVPETLHNVMGRNPVYDGPSKNTGVKGVIEDYMRDQRRQTVERERLAMKHQSKVHTFSYGVVAEGPSVSYAATSSDREAMMKAAGGSMSARAAAARKADEAAKADDGADSLDEDDDDFMEQYRKKRMAEMRASRGRPVFGAAKDCEPLEYLNAIESTDPRCPVFVLLFEPYIPESMAVYKRFADLASRHKHANFLRMQPTKAKKSFDHITLPCIQVYKGGDMIDSFYRVQDTIGEFPSTDDVEWLLHKYLDNVTGPARDARPTGESGGEDASGTVGVSAATSGSVASIAAGAGAGGAGAGGHAVAAAVAAAERSSD